MNPATASAARTPRMLRLACRLRLGEGEWQDAELRAFAHDGAVAACPALLRRGAAAVRAGTPAQLRVDDGARPIALDAVVERVEADNVVLSLAGASAESRARLVRRVEQARASVRSSGARRRAAAVLARARETLSGFLAERFPRLFEHARETLFAGARDATSDVVQTECFDAMQEVERLRRTITSRCLQIALDGVDALRDPTPRTPPAQPAADAEPLALIDTNSMNDWLTVVAIVSRTRPTRGDAEKRLRTRLGRLLDREIAEDDNPFGVQRLASAFHDSLQNLAAEKRTRRALFQAFEHAVVGDLHVLEAALATLLSEAGVDDREQAPRVVRNREEVRSSRPGRKPEARKRPPAPADGEPWRQDGVAAAAGEPPAGSAPGDGDRAARVTQLCGRLLGAARPARGATRPAAAQLDAAALDTRLAELQQAPADAATPFAEQLAALVDAAPAGLAPRPAEAVTTGAAFVDALLADPLLDPVAHRCLRRLRVALVRALVMDSSFLARRSHPVRRLLDDIGQVVGRIDDEDGVEAGAILDAVATAILAAPRPDPDVFETGLVPVAALLANQRGVIADRVARLLRERALPTSRVREWRRRLHADGDATGEHERPLPAEWRAWLDQARHVRTDDVLIDHGHESGPLPLRVVWTDPDAQHFLLADPCGDNAEKLTRQELAMSMRRGLLRLLPVVSTSIVERALLGVLGQAYGHAAQAARQDPLTGLAARRPFEWALQRALSRCQPGVGREFLLVTQIDGFDAVSRRCGEESTARLLTSFADILCRQFGEGDAVARLYGSRFAMLAGNTNRADVLARAERLRRTIEQARCVHRGETLELRLSVAVLPLDTRLDGPDQAVRLCEGVLAQAAADGGNRVRIEEFRAAAPRGREDETFADLLASGLVALRCQRVQPLAAGTDALPYYEVLLGIRDEKARLQPPGRLIAAAERSGEIAALDRWVVDNTLDWLKRHPRALEQIGGLALNLSGVTLSDETLLPFILQRIEASGVAPGCLMFEVTESATIADLEIAQAVLRGLRDAGCRTALDDFGTGSASFAYLKQLPVDTVKIDGLFVRELLDNPNDRAMVQSINEIAHCLGRATVAEFAENASIIDALREIGVDYAQGHGIARPEPLETLLAVEDADCRSA